MFNGLLRYKNITMDFSHIADRYCDANWHIPQGTHSFHNIMFVVSGSGETITDGSPHAMLKGSFIYHCPGQEFGFSTSNPDFMHCFGINFNIAESHFKSGKWFTENIKNLPFDNHTLLKDVALLTKLFKNLADVWANKLPNYHLKLNSIFLNILSEVSSNIYDISESPKTTECIRLTKEYINQNFSSKITMKTLSQLSGYNSNYLSSLFKQQTGISPIEYINHIRCEKAKELLTSGISVTDIALKTGFSDVYYFSRVFKKTIGISPNKYSNQPLNYC